MQSILIVLGLALLAFSALIALAGVPPIGVLATLATGGTRSAVGIAEALVKATPIVFCALAAAVPARLGLVNIGGEGQFLVGAIAAASVARVMPGVAALPGLSAMAILAVAAGAAWGLLPGALRSLTRANETVIGLLLNYVAGLLLLHLIHGPWKDPGSFGWPQAAALPEALRLPGVAGTRVHALLVVAVGLAFVLAFVMARTVAGFGARIIEASPAVARYLRIRTAVFYAVGFALAGGLAALGGFGELSAIQGRLRDGMSLGYGYAGFFVAWLCRNRFGWIPVGSLLFAFVITGADSLQVYAGMPFATVYLLQGLLFLALLGARPLREAMEHRRIRMAARQ